MSRNNLIIVVIVIVALAGGLYLLNAQRKSSPPPTSPVTEEQPTETSTPSATRNENIVTISSSGFAPLSITIKAGETVTWVNNDTASHQVNSAVHPTHQVYPPLNNVGLLKVGEQKSLTFPEAGTYKYHDHLNPTLTGTVVVE